MLPTTKALFAFAGRFLLVFCFVIPLWFIFTPAYNRLLAAGASSLLSLIEKPHVTTLVGWKHNIAIVRSDAPMTRGIRVKGFTGYLTHFNVILLVALVLAPRQFRWPQRCRMLGIGLGVLFVTHLVYLLIGVKYFEQPELEALQDPAGRLSVWGVNFYLSMASQLLPVLIWMTLYRTVNRIPEPRSTFDVGDTAGREAGKQG